MQPRVEQLNWVINYATRSQLQINNMSVSEADSENKVGGDCNFCAAAKRDQHFTVNSRSTTA